MINTKKENLAFTLVELIVAIVILSILATVGFVSYSGYVKDANDTKRRSDIALLNNSLKSYKDRGIDLGNFIKNSNNKGSQINSFFMKGIDVVINANTGAYNAGEIDINRLDVGKDIIDPSKKSYVLGTFMGEYEIASTLSNNKSYIDGSYKKRTSSGSIAYLTGEIDSANNGITLKNFSDYIKFRVGDVVFTGGVSTFTIRDIKGSNIYFYEKNVDQINPNTDKIMLRYDDTNIIGNSKNGLGTGTGCTQDILNLKENSCPISDVLENLNPYKIN